MAGIGMKSNKPLELIFLMPLIRDAIADEHFAPTWMSMALRMQLMACWYSPAWAAAKWEGWYEPGLDASWPDWRDAMAKAARELAEESHVQVPVGKKYISKSPSDVVLIRLANIFSGHCTGKPFTGVVSAETVPTLNFYHRAIGHLGVDVSVDRAARPRRIVETGVCEQGPIDPGRTPSVLDRMSLPRGLSLPWLLALDCKPDAKQALMGRQQRVAWALQVKTGDMLDDGVLATIFKGSDEVILRSTNPTSSTALQDPAVIAAIAQHLGPAGDAQWLWDGVPTPPAFYAESPGYWRVAERRAQGDPSITYAVARDVLELAGTLIDREREMRAAGRWPSQEGKRSTAVEDVLQELRQAMSSALYRRPPTPCPPPVDPDREVTRDEILAALPVAGLMKGWIPRNRSHAEVQYHRGGSIDLPPTADGRRFVIYPRYVPGYAQPAEIAASPEYAAAPDDALPVQRLTKLDALRNCSRVMAEAGKSKAKKPKRSARSR